jgi:hypothetical protein
MQRTLVVQLKNKKNMDKVKMIVNNPLFKAGLAVALATVLTLEGLPFYSGIALGIGIREFLLAFKK